VSVTKRILMMMMMCGRCSTRKACAAGASGLSRTFQVDPGESENNYFTEMCSGSEAGSYLRLIDFVYHSTLGLRVIKKKKNQMILGNANYCRNALLLLV